MDQSAHKGPHLLNALFRLSVENSPGSKLDSSNFKVEAARCGLTSCESDLNFTFHERLPSGCVQRLDASMECFKLLQGKSSEPIFSIFTEQGFERWVFLGTGMNDRELRINDFEGGLIAQKHDGW